MPRHTGGVHSDTLGDALEAVDKGLPMDNHSSFDFRNSAIGMIPDLERVSSFENPPYCFDGT